MITDPLAALATIVVVAAVCQLLASRLNVPSVLFLLVAGVALSSVVDPDELFGELLFTLVGLGVAVLLFEGGTSLNWQQLRTGKGPVVRLVTIGALIAWMTGAAVSALVLDEPTEIAVLLGAILIVSGPTVVIPLLQVVRPREPVASILRWEGIVIDPVGAGVAIVVLDAIIEERSPGRILLRVLTTFAAGVLVGAVASGLVLVGLRRQVIADHLQVPATFAILIGAYAAANLLRPEAGLISATLLGVAFANQRRAPAAHIAEFNENLGATVLGVLFIVLGARVNLSAIADNLVPSLVIIGALVLVARPASVIASTIGTGLSWRDRGFLMVLSPRGVVAAAVASLFALELEHHDLSPGPLVPITFTVVVGTVLITGLVARFAAGRLRVARPDPNGVALVGGGRFSIELADLLQRYRIPTLHIGLEEANAAAAADRGQLVYQGRLDTEAFPETVEAVGIGAAVTLSGTDHLDAYASERLAEVIGRANLYGVSNPEVEAVPGTTQTVAVQTVLPPHLTADELDALLDAGHRLRTSPSDHLRQDWLTIGRIDLEGRVIFDTDPDNARGGDQVIQFGPDDPVDRSLPQR